MGPILESLPNLIGYSIPTILVIAGLVLFFLPFFKDTEPTKVKSARTYGLIVGILGIVLALIIKPPEPTQQLIPIYILPTPASSSPSDTITIPATNDAALLNTPTTQDMAIDLMEITNTLEPVTSIIPVWAIEENGVQVNISESGVYRVEYLGDAYSPWPNEQHEEYRGWTTIV